MILLFEFILESSSLVVKRSLSIDVDDDGIKNIKIEHCSKDNKRGIRKLCPFVLSQTRSKVKQGSYDYPAHEIVSAKDPNMYNGSIFYYGKF